MTPAPNSPATHPTGTLATAPDPRAEALRTATRWDRARWLSAADDLLAATTPYASAHRSLIRLPGPVSASGAWSDGLEGYARTFLLAALRVRGSEGADPHGLLDRYAEGLRHGTDPASAERWPRIDERRQAVVEAASVAIGLSETRPWLWDRLDETTRQRTVDWLAGIVGTSGYTNNWLWFQNVVEAFLASVGGPWDPADLDRNEDTAESLYVGDGWYSDGRGFDGRRQNFDHYAGWAWHLYPVLHARVGGTPLHERHTTRLRAYLDQAQHLVSSRGAPVLQGRSVTYRAAALAPFWAGALADATPLAPGATRTLTAAVAAHFADAGAPDDAGLLPVGWHGRFDRVRQLYTGGSSPYWAAKGFLGLLLAADHPVWTAEPELPESWRDDRVVAMRAPGWLVSTTPRDGVVRLLNHGSDRALDPPTRPRADDPFYRRLGYSGATSPQLAPADVAAPLDSHTALLDAQGLPSHRDAVDRVWLDDRVAISCSRVCWLDLPVPARGTTIRGGAPGDDAGWAAMRRGPTLTTASVVHGPHELRLAWWSPATSAPAPSSRPHLLDQDAAWPADPGPWRLHVGGWPLAAGHADDLVVGPSSGGVRVRRADGTTSAVRAVPLDVAAVLDVADVSRSRDADPLGAASVTPWLRTTAPVGPHCVVAALVQLTGPDAGQDGQDAAPDPADLVTAHTSDGPGGRAVEVRWHDGRTDTVVVTNAAAHDAGPQGPK